ncbi:MAG: DUF1800 domain-containing protein [Bacteroidetes bacterium]|nr:DUF1800 domain-containing protein [Bacteroidota bacterium]
MKKYEGPWTDTQLKHLLRRTLFGITPEDYRFFRGKTMDQCLDILLDTSANPFPPVYFEDQRTETIKEYKWDHHNEKFIMFTAVLISCFMPMMHQQRNIGERMVLFWHNHFVTRYQTTQSGVYTMQYFMLLRKHVTGNFKQLLREITTNAQMLLFLDGNKNSKNAPNENYARELQELFSLGKGPGSRYTEADVQAAAKVLTGWIVDHESFAARFDPDIHDITDKTFSSFYHDHVIKGKAGPEGQTEIDELVDMICRQPEASRFMCRKLYRWFVNSNIDAQVEKKIIAPLADIFIRSDYEVKPVLHALLSSDFFYNPDLIGGIIKSPIDFMIALLREFDLKNDETDPEPTGPMKVPFWAAVSAGRMGQEIGSPPTVAGWPAYYEDPLFDKEWLTSGIFGQAVWIDKVTTLDRTNPEETIHLDLISFVKALSNPADSIQWLAETTDLLYALPPGEAPMKYLQKLADTSHECKGSWNEVWAKYIQAPENEALSTEIKKRLRDIFQNLLTYPEYKIR